MTSADYTRSDIVAALEAVGIREGDTIFTHSNLGFFGKLDDADTRQEYGEAFLSAIRVVLGEDGTLVVPTFTYSFTDGDRFDPASTASDMGLFSEFVRDHPESVRSADPNFSVSAIGRCSENLTESPPANSFGPDSFWERFLAVDGTYCNFNFDAASSSIHYVERCFDVPYRWDKPFAGTLVRDGYEERRVFYHYVRDLGEEAHEPDFAAFDEIARQAGVVEQTVLGKGQVVSIGAQETYDVIEQAYLADRSILIKGDEV